MLADLLYSFSDQIGAFNVFRYVTVRTAGATVTALTLSLGLGPWLIRRLQRLQIGERIRPDGPSSHLAKAGTPTMGGVLVVASILAGTILWADLGNALIQAAIFATFGYAALGFFDDYQKLSGRGGLRVLPKLGAQIGVGALTGLFLLWRASADEFTTQVAFPFYKTFQPELGWLLVPAAALVLVASSNAVNLTDGLDGLASGCVVVAAAAFALLTYVSGHAEFSDYLDIVHVPGVSEVTVFGAAVVGAALGFLWFNAHPAQVFMGDVGSLALGAAVGIQAVLIRQEVLLVLVGGVFVVEAASVLLQVASFKLTGRRLFRMAPIHHHFELRGWKETQISVRFWILAALCALATLTTLKLR